MFGSRVKDLKEQVEFLKSQLKQAQESNNELRLTIIALAKKSGDYYNAKITDTKLKTSEDILNKINNKIPKTEEEKKGQEKARRLYKQVFQGA